MLMIVILLFNLLFRSMSSFLCMRRTAVQMPMLRGSFFSVSEAPDAADAVSRVHVDLACFETDFMPAFQLIPLLHTDVSVRVCTSCRPFLISKEKGVVAELWDTVAYPVNHEYGPLNLPARHYLLAHYGLPALGQ